MKRFLLILVAAVIPGALVGTCLALIFRGAFVQHLLTIAVVEFVGLPLALAGALCLGLGRGLRKKALETVGWGLLGGAAGLCATLVAMPLGASFRRSDITDAVVFCESVASRLDAFRQKTGSYPERLDLVEDVNEGMPEWLAPQFLSSDRYRTNGAYFELRFWVYDYRSTEYVYDSRTGVWTQYE